MKSLDWMIARAGGGLEANQRDQVIDFIRSGPARLMKGLDSALSTPAAELSVKRLRRMLLKWRFLEAKVDAGFASDLAHDLGGTARLVQSEDGGIFEWLARVVKQNLGRLESSPGCLFEVVANSIEEEVERPTRKESVELIERWWDEKKAEDGFVDWLRSTGDEIHSTIMSLRLPGGPFDSKASHVLAVHNDQLIVVGSAAGAIHVYDSRRGALLYSHSIHESELTALALSSDGLLFCSAGKDGLVAVGNIATGIVWGFHLGAVEDICFDAGADRFLAVTRKPQLDVFEIPAGDPNAVELIYRDKQAEQYVRVIDGGRLITWTNVQGGTEFSIKNLSESAKSPPKLLFSDQGRAASLDFKADAIAHCEFGRVSVWSIPKSSDNTTLPKRVGTFHSFSRIAKLSPDAKMVATYTADTISIATTQGEVLGSHFAPEMTDFEWLSPEVIVWVSQLGWVQIMSVAELISDRHKKLAVETEVIELDSLQQWASELDLEEQEVLGTQLAEIYNKWSQIFCLPFSRVLVPNSDGCHWVALRYPRPAILKPHDNLSLWSTMVNEIRDACVRFRSGRKSEHSNARGSGFYVMHSVFLERGGRPMGYAYIQRSSNPGRNAIGGKERVTGPFIDESDAEEEKNRIAHFFHLMVDNWDKAANTKRQEKTPSQLPPWGTWQPMRCSDIDIEWESSSIATHDIECPVCREMATLRIRFVDGGEQRGIDRRVSDCRIKCPEPGNPLKDGNLSTCTVGAGDVSGLYLYPSEFIRDKSWTTEWGQKYLELCGSPLANNPCFKDP